MERAGLDAVDAEVIEAPLQLTGGLLREGDGQDLRWLERSASDLAGDPVRDRRGLAGTGAGQDRDRPAEREGGLTLGLVQPGEDALEVAHRRTLPKSPRWAFRAYRGGESSRYVRHVLDVTSWLTGMSGESQVRRALRE